MDLSVHGHCEALAESRKDKRPLSAYKGQLHRRHGNDSTENARGVNGDVVQVGLGNRPRRIDFVTEENQGQELTGKIERPVITLWAMS